MPLPSPPTTPLIRAVRDFFRQQSTLQGPNSLTPQLYDFLRDRRPEVFTQDEVRDLMKKLHHRVKKIKAVRKADEAALAAMEELTNLMASQRMSPSRKAAYEKKNSHIIAKAKAVKAKPLSRLDKAYFEVDTELALMRDRGSEEKREAQEAAQKAKEDKKQEKDDKKREKEEREEEEKKEKLESRAKKVEERIKQEAELKAKTASVIIDVKTASLKRKKQGEEDLELDRAFKRAGIQGLTALSVNLPILVGRIMGSGEAAEGKEN
jgi:hypothetical protein